MKKCELSALTVKGVMAFVLSLALSLHGDASAYGQAVYRIIDEHGNIIFTDNPRLGGEPLELAPLPGLPPALKAAPVSRQVITPAALRPRGKPGQPFMPYDHFSIALPQQEARVSEGMTAVEVAIAPSLRADHQVRLLVNGEIHQTALHSDVFWLTGLAVGRHELQAELLDSSQRLQHRTVPVTIVVP